MKTESERKIERRSVMVVWRRDSWAVKYRTRKKRGRYWAAGFYAKDHSFSDVVKWVENQPNLRYEGTDSATALKLAGKEGE